MKSRNYFIEILFFMILGLIPRIILLISNQAVIESDEAIVGLMGKHILEGEGIPIFYYGQAYMGSLESIFASISFWLFGISNLSLKLVPLFFSLVLIGLTYSIGFVLGGKLPARISALFVSIAPNPLIIWSLKARGGFIETLVIGSTCILIALILMKRSQKNFKKDFSLWASISFLLGVGWWTNNQIIFYIAPLGVILLFRLLSYSDFNSIIKIVLTSILFFILGSTPFWIYNIFNDPQWESFQVLFGNTAGDLAGTYFIDYWEVAFPVIIGARRFWHNLDIFYQATTTAYIIYGTIIFGGLFLYLTFFRNQKRSSFQDYLPYLFMVLFLLLVPTIFSLSSFGWLSQAPRYLLPLYSILPVTAGVCLSLFFKHNSPIIKLFGFILLIGVISLNLCSNYINGIADVGQPIVYKRDRVAKDHTELYNWLNKKGYNHIYTNYWIGYRVAFETEEKITFTRFGTPRSLRIPEYEKDNSPHEIVDKVFVLVPEEAKAFEEWLNLFGKTFEKHRLDGYIVFYKIRNKSAQGVLIPLSADQISYFIPPWGEEPPEKSKNITALIDQNPATRWGSGKPQAPGMAIEIMLDDEKPISRIVLDHSGFAHDIPSALRISGYNKTGSQIILFDNRNSEYYREINEYSSTSPLWDIRFKPVKITKIRLELMEGKMIFDWSMNDLAIYASNNIND